MQNAVLEWISKFRPRFLADGASCHSLIEQISGFKNTFSLSYYYYYYYYFIVSPGIEENCHSYYMIELDYKEQRREKNDKGQKRSIERNFLHPFS
jgi:hypothetical protein